MINTRILDDIERMFSDNSNIKIERGADYITLSQNFTDNIHLSPKLFEREHTVFSHTITLYDDNSYKAVDVIEKKIGGPTGLSASKYKGEYTFKGFFYGLGKDMQTDETGLVQQTWSTEDIKAPIREYMEHAGLKKRPATWWTGKRIAIAFAVGWGLVLLFTGALLLFLKMKGML